MRARLIAFWKLVRELATDDAYERYVAHHTAAHPAVAPMSRREFYLVDQNHKWDGVKRCC